MIVMKATPALAVNAALMDSELVTLEALYLQPKRLSTQILHPLPTQGYIARSNVDANKGLRALNVTDAGLGIFTLPRDIPMGVFSVTVAV